MPLGDILVFIHVLAFVFWLGTDIGVFVGAKFTENPKFSVETRMTLLKLAMLLDIAPRVAGPVVFMTGVYLSNERAGVEIISPLLGFVGGLFWLVVVILALKYEPHTSFGGIVQKVQRAIQLSIIFGMGGAAIASFAGAELFPGWLAAKWLAFAWIALFAIGIDVSFRPAIKDYVRLQTEGASDEVNASLTKNLQPVYLTVMAVYVGTMAAAYFGINKPF